MALEEALPPYDSMQGTFAEVRSSSWLPHPDAVQLQPLIALQPRKEGIDGG